MRLAGDSVSSWRTDSLGALRTPGGPYDDRNLRAVRGLFGIPAFAHLLSEISSIMAEAERFDGQAHDDGVQSGG